MVGGRLDVGWLLLLLYVVGEFMAVGGEISYIIKGIFFLRNFTS